MHKWKDIGSWEVGCFIVSFILFVYATYTNNYIIAAVGGAVFGAVLSSIVSKISIFDLLQNIRSILMENITIGCTSSENEIEQFRRKWYFYYRTKKGGKEGWRCVIIDFSKNFVPNKLVCIITTKEGGKSFKYKIEGFVRGCRLVICSYPLDSAEEPAIYIFPFMAKSFVQAHQVVSGIGICETWDQRNMVSPCLMVENPEDIGWYEDGFIDDENICEKLTKMWLENTRIFYDISNIIFRSYSVDN